MVFGPYRTRIVTIFTPSYVSMALVHGSEGLKYAAVVNACFLFRRLSRIYLFQKPNLKPGLTVELAREATDLAERMERDGFTMRQGPTMN